MRFAYLNDTHVRSSKPRCRIDKDFYRMQLEKLREVLKIIKNTCGTSLHGVEMHYPAVHGGDIFHIHNPAHSLVRSVIQIFNQERMRLWVNPGNHDFFGAEKSTIERSGFGVCEAAGVFYTGEDWYADDLKSRAVFRIAPYQIEYPENFYWFDKKVPGKAHIVIAHDMLTTRPVPFPHKEITKLKTNADLVLCSHWHSQFIKKVGNTLFVNSGPLDAQTVVERHIKPAVAVIDIDDAAEGCVHAKFEFLKTTGYEEVEVREEDEKALGLADEFIAELKSSDLAEGTDIQQAIRLVGEQAGHDPKIVQKALDRVQKLTSCA